MVYWGAQVGSLGNLASMLGLAIRRDEQDLGLGTPCE